MPNIKAHITKYISDEPQPGIVELEVQDASGKTWKIHEKTAVVSTENITAQSQFPIETSLECTILDSDDKANTARISLEPWGLETVEGTDELIVNKDLVSS